jgi:ATP adenylyltransferase
LLRAKWHDTGGIKAVGYEQIWAPWRLEYILSEKEVGDPHESVELLPGAEKGCFLCRCAMAGDERGRLVVCRGERTVVILNRYPYNNGHLLVAPQQHHARLDQLDDATQVELTRELTRMVGLLEKVLQPEGFNIGLNLGRPAGAGLPGHLHWHLVPRWTGDTNFMPALAAVHVIPQSLDALWQALTAELAK